MANHAHVAEVNGQQVTVRYTANGVLMTKSLMLEDYCNILKNAQTRQERAATGFIFQHPLIRFKATNGNSTTLGLVIASHQRDVKCTWVKKGTAFPAFIPATIMKVNLKQNPSTGKYQHAGSSLAILTTDLPSMDSTVLKWQFSNVHNNGSICWGSVTMPTFDDINGAADYFPTAFFGSNFNGDLSGGTKVDWFSKKRTPEEIAAAYGKLGTVSKFLGGE